MIKLSSRIEHCNLEPGPVIVHRLSADPDLQTEEASDTCFPEYGTLG